MCPVIWGEGSGPFRHPVGFISIPPGKQDTGAQVPAAEVRPAGMHCTDSFMGRPRPEKGAGEGFYLLPLITEESPFIRVNGNDTLLSIGVPNTEFVGAGLLPDADDLPHRAAAVTAAPANKYHSKGPPPCRLVFRKGL